MNKTYKIWDRVEKINGVEPDHFLKSEPFRSEKGDIILVMVNGRVTEVQCKSILAGVYDIDINLDLDAFMAEYFAKVENDNKPEDIE